MSELHYRQRIRELRRAVDARLRTLGRRGKPAELRDACRYVLTNGGKRVRPILVLLSSEAVGGTAHDALAAGAAVEIMHNFTLVHDDIMDNAPHRRGNPTVHVRWGLNTALLAGDTLLALAYTSLLGTKTRRSAEVLACFTRGVLDVCEGQAFDLEYERRTDVTVREYFTMIEKKTGRLISTSTELGGIIGGGSPRALTALREYGHAVGRAFQLQDDLLDVVADASAFGKAIGGDIVEGKKTFLLLRAAQRARGADRKALRSVLLRKMESPRALSAPERRRLVEAVTALYYRYGVIDEARREVRRNTERALRALRRLPSSTSRDMLAWLARELVSRNS